jgi:chromosome segregation protein
MALARVLPPGGLLVSKAGHLFSRQGVVFHGPQSELHGVLQRQREIEDLQARIPERSRARADVEAGCARSSRSSARQERPRRVRERRRARAPGKPRARGRYLKLAQSSSRPSSAARRSARSSPPREEEGRERLEMQEAQHGLQTGARRSTASCSASRRWKRARRKRSARSTQRAPRSPPPSARVSEARFNERSCRETRRGQGAPGGLARRALQALATNRESVTAELGQLEEGQVREKLQAALHGEERAREVLGDARAALEHITDELRASRKGAWRSSRTSNPLRERITELRIKEQEAATHAEQYAQQLAEATSRARRWPSRSSGASAPRACRPRSPRSPRRSPRWAR